MDSRTLQRNKLLIRKSRDTNYAKNIISSVTMISDLIMKLVSALIIQIEVSLAIKADERSVKKRKDNQRRFASLRIWRRRSTHGSVYAGHNQDLLDY